MMPAQRRQHSPREVEPLEHGLAVHSHPSGARRGRTEGGYRSFLLIDTAKERQLNYLAQPTPETSLAPHEERLRDESPAVGGLGEMAIVPPPGSIQCPWVEAE